MVVSVILPLLILTFFGYISVHLRLVDKSHIQAISNFVIKVSLPAFLVAALASKDIYTLWNPVYFIAYALGSLLLFVFAYFVNRRGFGLDMTQSAVMSMGASMSNTGFIGTAILTMLIGSHAAVYLSLTLIIENLVIILMMLTLAEMGQQQGSSFTAVMVKTLKNTSRNPLILSIVLGLLLSLFSIRIPEPLNVSLEMLGKTAAPVALFVIGASMVGMRIVSLNLTTLFVVTMKVLIMPAVIFTLLWAMSTSGSDNTEMLYAGTLIAALPMPIAFGIFGQAYGLDERALTPLMISTFLGFAVVSGLIFMWY